ncbi:uncharacterized protein LOC143353500 [Halictus rubicundus]|uniref:uncharacterized protein LOC143353500 n=1 Tax=Halictus rubicundus TaxID=77578 RepID=UPI004036F5C0
MAYAGDGQFEVSYITMIWNAVASVGWYIVAILISLWCASPYIREKYTNWKTRKEEQDYAAKYHKNPDLLQERLSAVEASRQKMQQEYYEKCALAQKDREERAERKREAARSAEVQSGSLGHRLGTETDDRLSFPKGKSNSMKKEYNPLMGDNSRGYRPPKRSCCGKGGCG